MKLIDKLTEIDELATVGARNAAELYNALAGLESQLRETAANLHRPRSSQELQGLADFLLIAAEGMRQACESKAAAMVELGEITKHHIQTVRELIGNA